ncbi:uncharacterized protein DS421_10g305870 [Arachis hypogaea]|nr:uncharacterized protein DS421_10g305870 [Arachis hypogaea]
MNQASAKAFHQDALNTHDWTTLHGKPTTFNSNAASTVGWNEQKGKKNSKICFRKLDSIHGMLRAQQPGYNAAQNITTF